jgi:hypothetical protein
MCAERTGLRMRVAARRDVGQTIGFCRLSSDPRLTLCQAKDDRPQKAMVCPTFESEALADQGANRPAARIDS